MKDLPHEFKINILRDDDINRHLRIGINGDDDWTCDLITWLEHLCITGTSGNYVFCGTRDMFHLFSGPEVSLERCADAAVATDRKGGLRFFNRDLVRKNIEKWISESGESLKKRQSVETQIYFYLDDAETPEIELHEALMDFAYDGEIPFARNFMGEDYTMVFKSIFATIVGIVTQYYIIKSQPAVT